MDEISITKNLVKIPSFVDEKINEEEVQRFLYKFIKKNCPWLVIKRQKVKKDRFNLIATDGFQPKLVFVCHMDTVNPAADKEKMLRPKIKGGRLYGLGAADMKAGIAAVLSAVCESKKTKGLTLIFDCDEEYYFKGIGKIFSEYKLGPKLVICPEPTNLEIVNGCRGILELEFDVLGKSAHGSQPEMGINAIIKAIEIFEKLEGQIRKNDLKELGKTTVNLAYLNGGLLGENGKIKIQPNAVPNAAKVILDIRPANPNISAEKAINLIETIAKKSKAAIRNKKINLNYKPYLIKRGLLKEFEQLVKSVSKNISFRKDLSKGGFYESALIYQAWKAPAVSFGPIGIGHSANERVDIKSVKTTKEIFKRLIREL